MHQLLNFSRKKRQGKCLTPRCRKLARKDRNYCNSCRSRSYDDPIKRLFWNLKAHAKARGKGGSLEISEFVAAAADAGYIGRSGRERDCLHVDRIDPLRGYEPGNIRFITCAENSRKAFVDRLAHQAAREEDPF